jgi:hypothetical protein
MRMKLFCRAGNVIAMRLRNFIALPRRRGRMAHRRTRSAHRRAHAFGCADPLTAFSSLGTNKLIQGNQGWQQAVEAKTCRNVSAA